MKHPPIQARAVTMYVRHITLAARNDWDSKQVRIERANAGLANAIAAAQQYHAWAIEQISKAPS